MVIEASCGRCLDPSLSRAGRTLGMASCSPTRWGTVTCPARWRRWDQQASSLPHRAFSSILMHEAHLSALSLSLVPEEVAEGRSLSLSGMDRIVNTRMFHAVGCGEMSQPLPTATAPYTCQPCLNHRASSCRGRTSSGPLASKPSPSACQPACHY